MLDFWVSFRIKIDVVLVFFLDLLDPGNSFIDFWSWDVFAKSEYQFSFICIKGLLFLLILDLSI